MRLPLLPLRDIVIFPDMIVPLFVGREKSVIAVEEVMKSLKSEKNIPLVTQKDSLVDNPNKDLYKVGVLANVLQMLKLPDGTVKVLVEGISRVHIKNIKDIKNHIVGDYIDFPDKMTKPEEGRALVRAITEQFDDYVKVNKKVSKEVTTSVSQIDDPVKKLSNTVAAHLGIKISEKQELLEIEKTELRLKKFELLESELDVLKVEKKIRSRVKKTNGKKPKRVLLE